MQIRVSLDRYLERHNLSAYRLANELKGRVAQGSVYAMTRSKTVKRVDLKTLSGVLEALERITGEPVTPNDLLEIVEESTPALETLKPGETGEDKLKIIPSRGKFTPRPALLSSNGSSASDTVIQQREERAQAIAGTKQ